MRYLILNTEWYECHSKKNKGTVAGGGWIMVRTLHKIQTFFLNEKEV